jgi:hypothetical protein
MLQNNRAPTMASMATAAVKPAQILAFVRNLTDALLFACEKTSPNWNVN